MHIELEGLYLNQHCQESFGGWCRLPICSRAPLTPSAARPPGPPHAGVTQLAGDGGVTVEAG